MKQQRRRFREVLDDHLVNQTRFNAEQLKNTHEHPLLYELVSKLVWIDYSGQCGLYREGQLAGLSAAYPIRGELRLAHPLDWLLDGTLSAWQRHAVAQQLTQPVQQIFRALYVPTPAELEAGLISQRYAQRQIHTRIAAGIFKQRRWKPTGWREGAQHSRSFAGGYAAHFDFESEFGEDYHYFTEADTLQTAGITFSHEKQGLALASVLPITFSEAMRDLDLLIARAITDDGEGYTSSETVAARHALLQALSPALGGERLSIGDRAAHVQGKRAKYRINLASAHIHIEPGAYLCVIPDWSAARSKVRLPFEDSDDRTAEIISKIVLLLDDDKITDPSILQQINRST